MTRPNFPQIVAADVRRRILRRVPGGPPPHVGGYENEFTKA